MSRTLIRVNGYMPILLRMLSIGFLLALISLYPSMMTLVEAGNSARVASQTGDFARAAQSYHLMYEIQPWNEHHLIAAVDAEMRAGLHEDAALHLDQIAERRALTTTELAWLGTIHASRGDADDAIDFWEQARQSGSMDAADLRELADLYLERGLREEAISVLSALVAIPPANAPLYLELGLLQALDQPNEAALSLGQAIAVDPTLAEPLTAIRANVETRATQSPDFAYTQLGILYLVHFNELTLAEAAFQRAVEYNPAYPEALAYLGYVSAQRDHSALGAAGQAIALDPNNPTVLMLVGLTWKELDHPADARLYFERAYALNPTLPVTCVEIAGTHRAERGLEWAEIWMQEALRLAPNDPRIRTLFVQFYVDEDYRVDEVGLELAKELVADYPDSAEAHDALAVAYYLTDDYDSAQAELDQAMTLDPKLSRAFLHMGQLMEMRGQPSHAMWYYIRVTELDPESVYAAHARRAIERLGGGS